MERRTRGGSLPTPEVLQIGRKWRRPKVDASSWEGLRGQAEDGVDETRSTIPPQVASAGLCGQSDLNEIFRS
jgi:hypothetical protein